jgi:hypothetical protein
MVNTSQLSPNCPDQAGLVIHQMAMEVLSPDSPRSAIKILVSHLRQKGMRVDHTRVSAWCNGHFLGNRQMTIEQFQEIVNIFWHQPGGIQTVAEIFSLASCIGNLACGQQTFDLAKNLDYQWLLSLGYAYPIPFQNVLIPDQRYPFDPFTLPRDNIIERLTVMLNYAGAINGPIMILGQPGIGKSRLISHLACSTWGQQFGKKRVIYLNGGGVDSYLRTWHQEIHGFPPPLGIRGEDLANIIRQHEKNTRQIILVDAVSHLRYIKPLLGICKGTSSVVILTPHSIQGIDGLKIEKRATITLTGFTLAESKEFYEKRWASLNPEDLRSFEALHKILKGNPLALHFAFQNVESEGFARLVHLLKCSDTDIPKGLLKETFLTLQVSFERLPTCLQKFYVRLGAISRFQMIDLEALAALWADSPQEIDLEKTAMIINRLQASICPFEPVSDEGFMWRLDERSHLFAKCKLEEADPCEQLLASQWITRLDQSGNFALPTISLRKAAETHFAVGFTSSTLVPGDEHALIRLVGLLTFGIDVGREVIDLNCHNLTSYEYFVAYSLEQMAFSRRKWFVVWQLDLLLIFVAHKLYSNNSWSNSVEGLLALASIILYGNLFCEVTKSCILWAQLWAEVSSRISQGDQIPDQPVGPQPDARTDLPGV